MALRSSMQSAGFAVILALQVASPVWSQDESRSERFFRYLDRDNNGRIEGEELQAVDGRMRERMEEAGLRPDRPISRDDFVRRMDESRERRRDDDGDSRRDRDRDSGRPSFGGRGPGGSAKPAEKVPLTLRLPAQYAAFDKNQDNQIGLYEWDRARYAEFVALDRNGDGFLTARELDDPPKTAAASAGAAVAMATSAATATSNAAPNAAVPPQAAAVAQATPATTVPATTVPVATTPAQPDSPENNRAKYFFSITDKNKDGSISAEEWAQSRGVRVMFEKASVAVQLPLSEATFVQQFTEVQKKRS